MSDNNNNGSSVRKQVGDGEGVKQRKKKEESSLEKEVFVSENEPNKKKHNWKTLVEKVFRMITLALYAIISALILFPLFPLYFLNAPLRSMGYGRYLPTDLLSIWWARGYLYCMGGRTTVHGKKNVPLDRPIIYMYNHNSNYDPFFLVSYSPTFPKFVFKRELIFFAPFIFCLVYFFGHIPINRKKRESAIESLNQARDAIIKDKKSVCIAPEGTRSPTGKLQDFKRGPFHLAVQTKVPIIPVVLDNTFNMWSIHQLTPNKGHTNMTFLEPIDVTNEDTPDTIEAKVKKAMESELETGKVKKLKSKGKKKDLEPTEFFPFIVWVVFILLIALYKSYF